MLKDLKTITEVLESHRAQWTALFGEDGARELASQIDKYRQSDASTATKDVHNLLKLLESYAKVVELIADDLGIETHAVRGYYEPTPGDSEPIPATVWMVCPKDPLHPRKKLQQKGDQPKCDKCGAILVNAVSERQE